MLHTVTADLTAAEQQLEAAATRLTEASRKREAAGEAQGRRGRAAAAGAGGMEVLASRRAALLAREADLQRR